MKLKTVLGVLGLLAGAAIAIAVPWGVLLHGKDAGLSSGAIVALALAGIGGGVIVAATSIFFAIVTPSRPHD